MDMGDKKTNLHHSKAVCCFCLVLLWKAYDVILVIHVILDDTIALSESPEKKLILDLLSDMVGFNLSLFLVNPT